MNRALLRLSAFLLFSALGSATVGCGSGYCDDLAEVCVQCPDTGNGIAAKDSCEKVVAQDDEDTCEDRVEFQFYEALGCGVVADD